jgi:Na+/H+ antiporter NhaD/arsenite permease-like protein
MDAMGFVKKNYLLVISAFLAFISILLVPFETVLSYDYGRILKTICTLLFFLLIVAGLKECNVLNKIAQKALSNIKTTTALCLVLIFLPFFSAMLFSNDVSLLTFVPISITILRAADMKRLMISVVVLQTAAANLGSYLTPIGNPHNMYIFNLNDYYGFSLSEYEMALIPIVAVGTVALLAMTMMLKKKPLTFNLGETEIENRKAVYVLMALFVLSVITVLNVVPFYVTLLIIVATVLVLMPKVFVKVDYSILFIFFFLFVFASGITNLETIRDGLVGLMEWDPMLTTVIVSQFTSNVPSTILLQPFTSDWAAVLVGADIGGFGTPIASMASIISLKLYLNEKDSSFRSYIAVFAIVNITILALLIPTYYLFC